MDHLFLAAGGGFLVAVIWMDLMFDVLALGPREQGPNGAELSEESLSQISGYYYRVTTTARPMNLLISAVMLAMIVVLVVQVFAGDAPLVVTLPSRALCGVPIGLALVRVFPNAVRLGSREDTRTVQTHLATAICVDHLLCIAAMLAFLAVRFSGLD